MIKEQSFEAKMNVKGHKLFVGDICYALRDDIYDDVWGDKQNYQNGVITDGTTNYAIVVGTAYGDGCYYDSTGNEYCVDAGVLGVTNMDYLRDDDSTNLGTIVTIPDDINEVVVYVSTDEDGFVMVDIDTLDGDNIFSTAIDTGSEGEDDEDYWWNENEDENEDENNDEEDN